MNDSFQHWAKNAPYGDKFVYLSNVGQTQLNLYRAPLFQARQLYEGRHVVLFQEKSKDFPGAYNYIAVRSSPRVQRFIGKDA